MRDHGNPYHSVIGFNTRATRQEAVASLIRKGYLCPRTNRITDAGCEAMKREGL